MRTVPAIIYGGLALAFYAVGLLLVLGYRVPGGDTVRGFAWGGLVTTWWGRAVAASFAIFLGTLLLLLAKRLLQANVRKVQAVRPNGASLTDTSTSPLRAQHAAAKRER